LLNDSDTSTRTRFYCPTGYQIEQIRNQTRERESYCFVEKSKESMVVILDMLPAELLIFQITPGIEPSFFLRGCPAPVRKCNIRNQIMHIQVTIEETGNLYLELNSKYMPVLLNGVGINHMFSRRVKEKLWKVDIDLKDCVKVCELTGWNLDIADYHFSNLKDLGKSWEELGIKGYKGEGIYQTTIKMDDAAVKLEWELSLPEYPEPFELYVNNSPVGTVLNQRCIKITPDMFEVGDNELKIVTINNGDSYYYNKTPYQDLIQNNSGRIGKIYLKPLVEFFLAFSK